MSKASDNEDFASLCQVDLKEKGFYKGALDEWAGPETQEAYREFAGIKEDPTPTLPPVDPPSGTIALPHEKNLNRFYGSANSRGSYLEWFSFPVDNIVLYSRNGQGLLDRNNDGKDEHRCHKKVRSALENALQEIFSTLGKKQFEKEGWHVFSGCFNYRQKRGGSSLSTHAWGIAIDINGNENPYASSKTTFSDTAIDMMEKHGFLSGGRAWGKDWMHFQAAIPYVSSGSYYDRNGLPKHIKQA